MSSLNSLQYDGQLQHQSQARRFLRPRQCKPTLGPLVTATPSLRGPSTSARVSAQSLALADRLAEPPLSPSALHTAFTARLRNLNLHDFFPTISVPIVLVTPPEALEHATESTRTAQRLRQERDRLTHHIKAKNWDQICCVIDRAAVITIYNDALQKVAEWELDLIKNTKLSPAGYKAPTRLTEKHNQLFSEAQAKVKVVLGVKHAGPRDIVFSNTSLLQPLEPRFARPRIDFNDDKQQQRSTLRLKLWRDEGWPDKYPAKTVELEKKAAKKSSKKSRAHDRLHGQAGQWSSLDWGDDNIDS